MRNDAAIDTPILEWMLRILGVFAYDLCNVKRFIHLALGNGVGHDSRDLSEKL